MANSLLDFVMAVVRDPDIAAQYAANPAQTIADAHLTDVTTTDVSNLIPVVAESLPATVPSAGLDAVDGGHNVWTSGAATAAFDAFDDRLPVQGVDDTHAVVTDLVSQHADLASTAVDLGVDQVRPLAEVDGHAWAFDVPVIDDLPVVDEVAQDVWDHPIVDHPAPHPDPSGFDVFD